jgi:hypothetical protein
VNALTESVVLDAMIALDRGDAGPAHEVRHTLQNQPIWSRLTVLVARLAGLDKIEDVMDYLSRPLSLEFLIELHRHLLSDELR